MSESEGPILSWTEGDQTRHARWRSHAGLPPPRRVVPADDTVSADHAYRLACEGVAILWQGDFNNARQLLQAIARRIERRRPKHGATPQETFNLHRLAQSQRARTLAMLLVPLDAHYRIPLRRAPDLSGACAHAYGPPPGDDAASVVSLRELLGMVGAFEWHRKGVVIDALGGERIHPHYGVFSPVRGEYLDLIAQAPLPKGADALAFDIGTGTGVIAALLARRGVRRVIATDVDSRALDCARENVARLGLSAQVEVVLADLFPLSRRAPLVVCNPPWVPARPSTSIEHAVFDPDSRMLRGFLTGLPAHLAPGGEGWLIMSDLAEHLGLRSREAFLAMIDAVGLQVLDRADIRPRHPKASDAADPLHAARAREVTSLWRLAVRGR
ncbi:class I SAM-dependent methyltransferase [Mycetohabitans sp. B8]|uniref:methyltransferase n=1 Tax=Mycetohabitans sp. B8 TaxID=2841845 RepID=UPI001F373379|nr:class I SAM-dependent methyltransferase [Mycetohabitans sp. B8]MCG1041141.1 class I SAM-dependent methyltransferase [Mycetohabitans sp. B8]